MAGETRCIMSKKHVMGSLTYTITKICPLGLLFLFIGVSQSNIISNCGFETNFCDWTTASWSDGNWTRRSGLGTMNNAGPTSAAEGVFYIVMEPVKFKDSSTGLVIPGKVVSLLSPLLSSVCSITFFYMKYGGTNGTLRVGLYYNRTKEEPIMDIKGQTDRTWHCANISFSQARQNVQVFVEAETGLNILGESAVDELFIYDKCNSGPTVCKQSWTSESTTMSSTITFMSSTTLTPGNNTVSSSTPITSSGTEENPGASFDSNLLYILIAPLVALIVAVVIAVVCFRRREKPGHSPEETKSEDETYDLPNEKEMRGTNLYVTAVDIYDRIDDDNL